MITLLLLGWTTGAFMAIWTSHDPNHFGNLGNVFVQSTGNHVKMVMGSFCFPVTAREDFTPPKKTQPRTLFVLADPSCPGDLSGDTCTLQPLRGSNIK